jgi:hypothetical protein
MDALSSRAHGTLAAGIAVSHYAFGGDMIDSADDALTFTAFPCSDDPVPRTVLAGILGAEVQCLVPIFDAPPLHRPGSPHH